MLKKPSVMSFILLLLKKVKIACNFNNLGCKTTCYNK